MGGGGGGWGGGGDAVDKESKRACLGQKPKSQVLKMSMPLHMYLPKKPQFLWYVHRSES